jgi:transposase-like protein
MKNTRRKFTAKVQAQVAIETTKERESMTDLAKRFEVHPAQITPEIAAASFLSVLC